MVFFWGGGGGRGDVCVCVVVGGRVGLLLYPVYTTVVFTEGVHISLTVKHVNRPSQ